jgi:hypothetical protein
VRVFSPTPHGCLPLLIQYICSNPLHLHLWCLAVVTRDPSNKGLRLNHKE